MLEWAMDGSALHVPSLWTWEILNTVAVVIKRKRITADRGNAGSIKTRRGLLFPLS